MRSETAFCSCRLPPVSRSQTIIKTWSVKIEGPCPAPGPIACGPAKKDGWGPGMLCAMAGVIATPFDFLFGGCDGVYGCFPGMGGGVDGDCGPCFGPIPRVLATVPMVLGAPTVMFGALW